MKGPKKEPFKLTRAEFLAWLRTQPADRSARISEQCHCPMASYAMEKLGWDVAYATFSMIFHDNGFGEDDSECIELVDFTFGSFGFDGGIATYGNLVQMLTTEIV